jgi:histidine triad (HIT) family protein
MTDCIFCKIANHEIPTKLIFESENIVVFNDIHPRATVHLLILPKKHLQEFYTLDKKDNKVLSEIFEAIRRMIEKYDLTHKGYRIATNGGGAQAIDHFHIHLMGGISVTREL